MKRILFQGDSITDCGRGRVGDPVNRDLGTGYPLLVAAELLRDGGEYEIRNRAVSGDRIADTYSRWIEDAWNVPYDILSILHGINDVGFAFRLNMGSPRERFAQIYEQMLCESEATHPEAKIVVLEPFLLPVDLGPAVEYKNDIFLDFDRWYSEIRARGAIAQALAARHGAIFVPLADDLAEAAESFGADRFSPDCIHLTPAGHARVARRWLEACRDIL